MRTIERPYPSFTLVLSGYRVSRSVPKSSRVLDLEDPLMKTVGTCYDDFSSSTRCEDSNTLVNLDTVVSGSAKERVRFRRLSFSTLVVDLALKVKHSWMPDSTAERKPELNLPIRSATPNIYAYNTKIMQT